MIPRTVNCQKFVGSFIMWYSHIDTSKDHFGLILNEPAGKIAKVVVGHSVNLIVQAWSDDRNPDDVITQVSIIDKFCME